MGKQGDGQGDLENKESAERKDTEHVDRTAVLGKGVGDRSPNQAISKMNELRAGGDSDLDLPEVRIAKAMEAGAGHGQTDKLQFLTEWGQKINGTFEKAAAALKDSVNSSLGAGKNTWDLVTVGAESG